MGRIEGQLGRLFDSGTLTGLSDLHLLERFATQRDEPAFEVLMTRYAPLVLGVCRKVLRDPNDVDDAFQATFLVLARKARSIRASATLGSWLCRVAYRIAVRAGAEDTRRRHVERLGTERAEGTTSSGHADRLGSDEIAVLYEELDRLPESHRVPIVLCHLQGLTTDAAAQRLGCPVGTVWGRLSRARARLRQRLVERGEALSAATLAGELAPGSAQAAVSGALTQATLRTAVKFASLDALAAWVPSANVASLTTRALKAMFQAQLKTAAMVFFGVGLVTGVGAGMLARGQQPLAGSHAKQSVKPQTRTLQFPANRALGIIHVQAADQLNLVPKDRSITWRRIGEARGLVRLPATGLVRLSLSKPALDDLSPLDQLAPDAIQSLSLDNLGARDGELSHIAHLTGLKEIELDGNFITNESLKPLAGLERLESISLDDSLIGDEGIRHIAGLRSVKSLSLYRSHVTDESLRLIGAMKTLKSLDLGITMITDRGIGFIKDLENLESLRFSDTNTSDTSLAVVGGLKNLRSLDFGRTRATDAGLAHLMGLKKLYRLRADFNSFTDAGLAHLATLPALEDLVAGYGARFTDTGLAALAGARALRFLTLGTGKFSDAGLANLVNLPVLERLRLSSSNRAITATGMVSLAQIKTLNSLSLGDTSLGGAGLAALGGLPALESLQIADDALTFDDLRHLERFNALKDLRLFRMSANCGRPTLRPFRDITELTWLELPHKPRPTGPRDGIDFEPAEFAYLSGLTKLETLEYSGRITDAGIKYLASMTAMNYLALRNAHLTDDGLKSLSGMKKLDFLVIGGAITDRGLKHLEALTSLRFLALETKTVSLEAIKELKTNLPALRTVLPFDQLDPLFAGPKITYTKIGENAPDFAVTTRDGKPFRLADYRGKVVLVHFWGPECAPCIRAMPKLRELHKELSARPGRFAMIGLTIGMEEKEWRAFLDQKGMSWPQGLLTDQGEKVWDDFHVRGIPDYAVIGPDGKIIADGESTGRDIEKLKEAILKALGP